MGSLKESASQTAGPYVHIGLAPGDAGFDIYTVELGRDIAGPEAKGARIAVTGVVYDAEGAPLKDVLVEIWQANADGIYPGAGPVEDGFVGFGRVIPDFETGTFSFTTIKPGAVDGMAPHLNLWLVSRGINIGLSTRMYFGDEERANATDSVLGLIPADRRATLFAEPTDDGYRFDIRLQGDDETVFFDI
ncbi:MAG: protocatechuate 3,4-dioxygenase subunit alpha [Silicimonas sp.]|nr:protocatechuate 3,4-dioxygenase subunit alpha [Silicimonas sp.]